MAKLAVLVGNGLSVACEPELSVENLTKRLAKALERRAVTQNAAVGAVLREFATRLQGSGNGFEDVVGSLQAASDALPFLSHLAALDLNLAHDEAKARENLRGATEFCATLQNAALSIVLGEIAHLAHAGEVAKSPAHIVRKFCQALKEFPSEQITIATLNYDGILHSGLLKEFSVRDVCDAARGDRSNSFDINDTKCKAYAVRDDHDIPSKRRVCLLNLHGSLGWLRNRNREVWKFDLGDLRTAEYWTSLAKGSAPGFPVVVLTNQKKAAVEAHPFKLLYTMFQRRLERASHWLIVGCSLQDEPVRKVLRDAWKMRSKQETYVYVIDKGERHQKKEWGRTLKNILGSKPKHLKVNLGGVEGATKGATGKTPLAKWFQSVIR